ncbi:MAG TPA: TonB-dependent receptor [Longimicrobiales bacterium]|nr:TonB-dependent receptor [Longimicrobiales bacterium]
MNVVSPGPPRRGSGTPKSIRVLAALAALAVGALLAATPAAARQAGDPPGATAGTARLPAPVAAAAPDTVMVNGIVVDSATGAPLPASVVRLVELDRQDLTHDDGTFHLRRVPAGTYTLVVEHLGYRTERRQVRIDAGQYQRIAVRLQPSAIDLPGVIVTATMGTRTREESLRPTQVVSGRDLQRQLDVTLAGTLEGEAGLASASMGPAPARPVIRGLGGDRILILEDGGRLGDVSSTSPDHAVAVEAASAERIEIVRGPAALFYGSNALGGVINVVREEIPAALPDHPTGTVLLQGQSVNEGGSGSAMYRNGLGPVGYRVELNGRLAGDVRTPLRTLPNTGIETWGAAAGAAWVADFGHAGGAVRAYRNTYGIPPDSVSGHAEGVTVEMERDAYRGEAVFVSPGALDEVTVTGSFLRYDHREIEASGDIGTAYGQNTATAEAVARHRRLGPLHRGGFGARAQWQGYVSDNGRVKVEADEVAGAIYALEEIERAGFQLQAGARFDIHRVTPQGVAAVRGVPVRERTFRNVSGSVAGLYELARGWRLGASISRAFRAPSADELFSQGPHLAAYTYEVGNPDLDAETGLGLDVFLRLDRLGISAEAAAFWNEISDYSYPSNTGEQRGELFVYRHVNTDARFSGAELSTRWNVAGDLVLDTDVSYVRATNLAVDEPLPLIPPLNGRVTLRWDRDRLFVEAGWRGAADQDRVPDRPPLPVGSAGYCDEVPAGDPCRPVPGEFLPTAGYSIFNAGAGYRWFPGHQVHSVTLRLENVADEVYRNHLSRIKELSPEPGFGATVSYRITF